jgi:hypothetical protein
MIEATRLHGVDAGAAARRSPTTQSGDVALHHSNTKAYILRADPHARSGPPWRRRSASSDARGEHEACTQSREMEMQKERLEEVLLQSLEYQTAVAAVYGIASECALDTRLEERWDLQRRDAEAHLRALTDVCRDLAIDPERRTPGRDVVRASGRALLSAIQQAVYSCDAPTAERIAQRCVALAGTENPLDWALALRRDAGCLPHFGVAYRAGRRDRRRDRERERERERSPGSEP